MVCLDTNIFLFFYLFSFDFSFTFSFSFLFFYDEKACDVIGLDSGRRGEKNNVKVHVNSMFTLWSVHGILMADIWTLGQE